MLTQFLLDWRFTMLRAFAALVFGVLTLVWPGLTLLVLVTLFGAYVLVDGVFTLVDVVRGDPATRAHRGWAIVEGVAGIAAGVITFAWPSITALALLFLIAVWAVVVGAVRLWIAIEARGVIPHAWLFGLLGVLSILFGVLLMITPGPGALVITWLIGWYAILFAALLFVVGWQQREIEHGIHSRDTGSMRSVQA